MLCSPKWRVHDRAEYGTWGSSSQTCLVHFTLLVTHPCNKFFLILRNNIRYKETQKYSARCIYFNSFPNFSKHLLRGSSRGANIILYIDLQNRADNYNVGSLYFCTLNQIKLSEKPNLRRFANHRVRYSDLFNQFDVLTAIVEQIVKNRNQYEYVELLKEKYKLVAL